MITKEHARAIIVAEFPAIDQVAVGRFLDQNLDRIQFKTPFEVVQEFQEWQDYSEGWRLCSGASDV
jgi:hypothetical protein